jgi:hypothetical protein
MTYQIQQSFTASPDAIRSKTYSVGEVVEPTNIHERNQMQLALMRGDAKVWMPDAVEHRIDKVKRAPRRK